MAPKVSIITGIYQSARYLPGYFEMLSQQTFSDWEAILVDDGSTDGSQELIRTKASQDGRFQLLEKKPEGYPSRSRAEGLKLAHAPYVAFCDHDDFWAPQKLAMQVAVMDQKPQASILHTERTVWTLPNYPKDLYICNPEVDPLSLALKQAPEAVILGGLRIIFSSFLGRTDQVLKAGFHPDMKGVDDFYLFFRLAALGEIWWLPLPLTYYRAHQGNLSHAEDIFVRGFYQVYDVLKDDPVPEHFKRSALAQAYRTHAVSLFAQNRFKALVLLGQSLRTYFIGTTLTRMAFLVATAPIPLSLQKKLMAWVKKIKFMFPTFKDILTKIRS